MKLKFVANFRNRLSKVLWNALYSNFIYNLVLYTTPKLMLWIFIVFKWRIEWWLMITCDAFVTHTRRFRGQINISSKQDDFSTFSTKALDIYKLPHSLIYISTTKRMSCFKTANIFYPTVPRIVKIFWETYRLYSPSLALKLFGPHVSRESNQMHKFSPKCAFFPFEFRVLE